MDNGSFETDISFTIEVSFFPSIYKGEEMRNFCNSYVIWISYICSLAFAFIRS